MGRFRLFGLKLNGKNKIFILVLKTMLYRILYRDKSAADILSSGCKWIFFV